MEFKTDEKKRSAQIGTINIEILNLIRGNQLAACQDRLDAIEVQESKEADNG